MHSFYENNFVVLLRLDRKIIDLQTLVMSLSAARQQEISCNVATEILTSYHYDFASNSRCEYHEELGTAYCALGFAKRYCYLMSDQLCTIYHIAPIRGKHLPIEKVVSLTCKSFDSEDFRRPAKFLRDSYRASNSRLARDTTDIRYENSRINEENNDRHKKSDQFDDSLSTISTNSNVRAFRENDSDEENEEIESNGGHWQVVESKLSGARSHFSNASTTKSFGRGRFSTQK